MWARWSVWESTRHCRQNGWIYSSPVLLALVPLPATEPARASHHTTRDVAADLLTSVEPYGVPVTVGDNDTFRSGTRRKWKAFGATWYREHVAARHRLVCASLGRPIYDSQSPRPIAAKRCSPRLRFT